MNKKELIDDIVAKVTHNFMSKNDPNGSYTGIPIGSENEQPEQDADDL